MYICKCIIEKESIWEECTLNFQQWYFGDDEKQNFNHFTLYTFLLYVTFIASLLHLDFEISMK